MRSAARPELFPVEDKAPVFSNPVSYEFPLKGVKSNGLVLVGEAPGAEEAKLGRPFVGRSGQLLDKTLAEAGIERKECLIANVFRRQPPANKVDHFFISRKQALISHIPIAEAYGKFGSGFCRAEFASDLDFLTTTLKSYKASNHGHMIVVALGRTPLWALTGESGLLQKVGQLLPCRLFEDTLVLPTFHPSYILRGNWRLKDDWVRHFSEAKTSSSL